MNNKLNERKKKFDEIKKKMIGQTAKSLPAITFALRFGEYAILERERERDTQSSDLKKPIFSYTKTGINTREKDRES